MQCIDTKDGELAVVTAKTTNSNWYSLTSRGIIGEMNQNAFDVPAERITNCNSGDDAKGYDGVNLAAT